MPVWSLPFLGLLLAATLWFGNLGLAPSIVVSVETGLAAIYVLTARREPAAQPVANVLPLLPVQLLLLFGISLLPQPDLLVWTWTAIPAASVGYDAVSRRPVSKARTSILTGLYCILWADVIFLLERWIALGKGLTGLTSIAAAVAFGVVGGLFLITGIRRHRNAAKE